MGKTIIITEKPSVAQEYKKVLQVTSGGKTDGYVEGYSPVLGKDVIITWAVGHLVSICSPEEHNAEWKSWNKENLPMIPDTFKYKPQSATYKQFNVVKQQYTRKDIDAIYYAGDSGREGIYIQALIRNQIFKTPPKNIDEKVVWIDSYTAESILNGIKNAKPYSDYQNMINSGYERAKADWLIGMNFTEALTLTSGGYKNVMNVGRVMTPTLAMIVNRQAEIDGFVKTDYYGIKTDFAAWRADKNSRFFDSPLLYNENGFLKKEDAEKLQREFEQDKSLTVDDVKSTTKTEYAPYQFNLADLQAYCSKAFHLTPAKTLEIAQSLYEKKFTTYPRTDSRFLTTAVQKDLKQKFGYDIPSRYVDDSKVTDHYALIPTFYGGNTNSLSDLESKVYQVICKRFDDMLKPPYIYDSISVSYRHANKEHFFESFKVVKQKGFKDIDNSEDSEIKNKPIPKKGDVVQVQKYNINPMETKPPAQYTTGSLILAMEKAGKLIEDEELREQIKTCGIGTSATRANIIDKLDGKFIEIDKSQKITPTEAGKKMVAIVEKIDDQLVSPVKTAEMEQLLSDIANGRLSVKDYEFDLCKYIKQTTGIILSENKERIAGDSSTAHFDCPCCNNGLKYGKFGWYCDTKNGGCGFSFGLEICGHKMKESDLEDLIKKGKTKDYTFKSPKTGKSFKAHMTLDKSSKKTAFEFVNDKAKDTKSSGTNTYNKNTSGTNTNNKNTSSKTPSSTWDFSSSGSTGRFRFSKKFDKTSD